MKSASQMCTRKVGTGMLPRLCCDTVAMALPCAVLQLLVAVLVYIIDGRLLVWYGLLCLGE